MFRNPRTIALTIAKFLVPAVIIGYLLWQIEPGDWTAIYEQPKNYGFLVAALFVAMTGMSISFTRWCLLVRAQGIQLTMLEAYRLGSICFLLSFISAGSVGGDLFKAIFLARRRPGKRVEAVASVLVDRACGLYGLLLLVGAALLMTGSSATDATRADELSSIRIGTAVLLGVGTAGVAALVLGGRWIDRLIQRCGRIPVVGRVIVRVGTPLRMFHTHPFAFAIGVAMSVGVQTLLAVSMFLIARGLYQAPPTLAEHLLIVPIAMLASALPLTPAGLGVLEATMAWLYRLVPSPPTQASGTLVALVFELVKLTMAAIGTLFYWTASEEVRHSLEIAEEEAAAGHDALDRAGDDKLNGAPQV